MPRNNRNWSVEEEAKLVQMAAEGQSFASIAKEMQRTEAAVSSRLSTVRNRTDIAGLAAKTSHAQEAAPATRPDPRPEDELGGGDICSLEMTPSDTDDEPL